jgi:hypothetical protein
LEGGPTEIGFLPHVPAAQSEFDELMGLMGQFDYQI